VGLKMWNFLCTRKIYDESWCVMRTRTSKKRSSSFRGRFSSSGSDEENADED
jgi:hypothetical protein